MGQPTNIPGHGNWVDVWTTMPQLTQYNNLPSGVYNMTPKFHNTTIRQTLKLDIPASSLSRRNTSYIRLRISNAFGTSPLAITYTSLARPMDNIVGTGAIVPETLQMLSFNGGRNSAVEIPPSSLAVSDPVEISFVPQYMTYLSTNDTVQSGSLLAVTLYLENGQVGDAITSHPGSRATSFLSFGNQVTAMNLSHDATSQTQALNHWFFIATVEAWLPTTGAATYAVVGDSITDGRASTDNKNDRWPDRLFSRLQQNYTSVLNSVSSQVTISNQGAGGNRVLADGLGPSALSRFDRDVLSHSGVRYVVIFEGANDIGTAPPDQASQNQVLDALIAAYRQLISRSHARRLPIFGATITPFGSLNTTLQPYSNPIRESTRQKINSFIREGAEFDAVIDFDAVVKSPQNATMLNPRYDSGDGLHPNVDGYSAMADAFPVEIFEMFRDGVSSYV